MSILVLNNNNNNKLIYYIKNLINNYKQINYKNYIIINNKK